MSHNINERELRNQPILKFTSTTLLIFLAHWAEDEEAWSIKDRLLNLREMYTGYVGSTHANDQKDRQAVTATFESLFSLIENLTAWSPDQIRQAVNLAANLHANPNA